jgi:hypothetical protein
VAACRNDVVNRKTHSFTEFSALLADPVSITCKGCFMTTSQSIGNISVKTKTWK